MATNWAEALQEAREKTRVRVAPKEVDALKDKAILRFSTADIEDGHILLLKTALEAGAQFLEEISIHFCHVLRDSPFHPAGDHIRYLRYLGHKLSAKFNCAVNPTPVDYCQDEGGIADEVLTLVEAALPRCKALKILALYAPPRVPEELAARCPGQLDALIIQSTIQAVQSLPVGPRLISLKNCGLTEGNSGFLIDYIEKQAESRQKLFKQRLFKLYGACHRHSTEDEILEHYTEEEKLTIRLQLEAPGPEFLDLSWNTLSNCFLRDFCRALQEDPFVRWVSLERNSFGNFVQRLRVSPPEAKELKGALKQTQEYFEKQFRSPKLSPEAQEQYKQFLLNAFTPNFYRPPSADTIKFLQSYCESAAELQEVSDLKESPIAQLLQKNKALLWFFVTDAPEPLQKLIAMHCATNRARVKENILKAGKVSITAEELENMLRGMRDISLVFRQESTATKEPHVKAKAAKKRSEKSVTVHSAAPQSETSSTMASSDEAKQENIVAPQAKKTSGKQRPSEGKTTTVTSTSKYGSATAKSIKSVKSTKPKSKNSMLSIVSKTTNGPHTVKTQKSVISASMETYDQQSPARGSIVEKQPSPKRAKPKIDTNQLLDQISDQTFQILVDINGGNKLKTRDQFNKNQNAINDFCQQLAREVEAGVVDPLDTHKQLAVFLCDLPK